MNLLRGMLLPIAIITCWFVLSKFNQINSFLIPSPEVIYQTAISLCSSGVLFKHISISLYRVLLGFSITVLLAFPLAVLVGLQRDVEKYLNPFLHFLRQIPPIACIPIIILWFGIGEQSKLVIIVLAAFFPVFLNCLEGFLKCDTKLIEVGIAYGFNKNRQFFRIMLPSAVPSIILGMRLGLGYSWRALIGAELIAASSGIGYMIIEGEQISRPDIVIVGILMIGLFGYLVDYVFTVISGWLMPWREEVDDGSRGNQRAV